MRYGDVRIPWKNQATPLQPLFLLLSEEEEGKESGSAFFQPKQIALYQVLLLTPLGSD